ncbi:hypothetical protein [Chryseosolibacter indicus]|uniref:Uncharacterized protein n=1 Tax=Chryseosolibacter indicus TaxID=2782351 RepID=A0ABS5VP73_9BACT|nr:hypothetical protein [Chryseosolibacter indicus]MBT1703239.1 hypothetical protein [Chryseosolibacter indicus]
MATIRLNPMVKEMRGKLGGIMFRKVNGTTILSVKPSTPKKQSEQQKANRDKFKEATVYAKFITKDPQKKAYYQQKAKKLKVSNAYTAAITEYMRKGEIKEITVKKTNNKPGKTIGIKVSKKDFNVNKVRVTMVDENGFVLATSLADKKSSNDFMMMLNEELLQKPGVKIKVIIEDFYRNQVVKEVDPAQY